MNVGLPNSLRPIFKNQLGRSCTNFANKLQAFFEVLQENYHREILWTNPYALQERNLEHKILYKSKPAISEFLSRIFNSLFSLSPRPCFPSSHSACFCSVKWAQATSFSLLNPTKVPLDPLFCVETDFVVYFAIRRQVLPLPALQR